MIRFAPLFLLWRFATFESLVWPDRVRVLERMESSRIVGLTLVLVGFKAIFSLV